MKNHIRNRIRAIIIYVCFILLLSTVFISSKTLFLYIFGVYFIFEVIAHFFFNHIRSKFQWFITGRDEKPKFSEKLLDKFFSDGFDAELGWSRKPNTSKNEQGKDGTTTYHINQYGQRLNSVHEKKTILISTYGDSFTFGRQVNDDETYQSYLSEMTESNVLNYGVGNYGIDQALLRLKREYPSNRSKIVILGSVPSTIVRILCVWKHYNEFGNTLAFKPRFYVKNNKLILKENIINTRDKYINYEDYLPEIKLYDQFYYSKFSDEILKFPYLYGIIKNPIRHATLLWNIVKEWPSGRFDSSIAQIMDNNLLLRKSLFKDVAALELMSCLVDDYIGYARKQAFVPLLLWMPQKDDILSAQAGDRYYQSFINEIKKKIAIIDLTDRFISEPDLNGLYSDDSHYGGHLSKEGNKIVAQMIYEALNHKYYFGENSLLKNNTILRDYA